MASFGAHWSKQERQALIDIMAHTSTRQLAHLADILDVFTGPYVHGERVQSVTRQELQTKLLGHFNKNKTSLSDFKLLLEQCSYGSTSYCKGITNWKPGTVDRFPKHGMFQGGPRAFRSLAHVPVNQSCLLDCTLTTFYCLRITQDNPWLVKYQPKFLKQAREDMYDSGLLSSILGPLGISWSNRPGIKLYEEIGLDYEAAFTVLINGRKDVDSGDPGKVWDKIYRCGMHPFRVFSQTTYICPQDHGWTGERRPVDGLSTRDYPEAEARLNVAYLLGYWLHRGPIPPKAVVPPRVRQCPECKAPPCNRIPQLMDGPPMVIFLHFEPGRFTGPSTPTRTRMDFHGYGHGPQVVCYQWLFTIAGGDETGEHPGEVNNYRLYYAAPQSLDDVFVYNPAAEEEPPALGLRRAQAGDDPQNRIPEAWAGNPGIIGLELCPGEGELSYSDMVRGEVKPPT